MRKKMYLNASAEWKAEDINTKGITHIIVASAHISENFRIRGRNTRLRAGLKGEFPMPGYMCTVPREKWSEISKLKENNPELKIIVSVGGKGSEGFSDMAESCVARKIFAESVGEYTAKHKLDGIDIDWQFPTVQGRGQIKTRACDKRSFTLLLGELRKELGDKKEISYTASCGAWYIDAVELLETTRFANAVHLMTYNMAGVWNTETHHHANLFTTSGDPDPHDESVDKAVNRFIEAGVPGKMILIGCAGYGLEFKGLNVFPREELPGLFFKFNTKDPHNWPDGTIPYNTLEQYYIGRYGFTKYWDDTACAAYLYNEDDRVFITYEDAASIKQKIAYAQKKELGGVFAWEYTQGSGTNLWAPLYQ